MLDKFKHKKILVLSTDLDNVRLSLIYSRRKIYRLTFLQIPIFARPQFMGVYMMGNTVGIRVSL